MKAIAVTPKKADSLKILDLAQPVPQPEQALVKTIYVGIDGTDIDIVNGLYGEAPTSERKLIIGHEAVGKIDKLGQKVKGLRIGDYIVPTVRRPCASCYPCSASQPDMCQSQQYKERGIKRTHGFLSEYFTESYKNLLVIPQELSDVAVLIEPLSVAQKAIAQVHKIQQRLSWTPKSALVLGAGPLGLLAAAIISVKEINTCVYDVADAHSLKASLVQKMGATYVEARKTPLEKLPDTFKKPDIIIEATGNSLVAFEAINHINYSGAMCLLSVTSGKHEKTICSDCLNNRLVLGNRVVFGSVSSNIKHFQDALKTLKEASKRWPSFFNAIITEKLSFTNFKNAFEKKDSSHIKSIITF